MMWRAVSISPYLLLGQLQLAAAALGLELDAAAQAE